MAAIPHDPALGDCLGNYLLAHLINADDDSQLFQALHRALRHPLALRVPRTALLAKRPDLSGEMLDEARRLAPLSHPHLVRLLDCGENPARPFFVYEFVKGLSLKHLIQQTGRLRWDRAVRLLTQITSALASAAQAGIAHGRLCPGQIMVTPDCGGKLILDIPAFRQDLPSDDIRLAYQAPEQLSNADWIDQRTDIFSLGVIGYEMLLGKRPFTAADRSEPPRLHDLSLEIPAPASKLIQQMLAADPRQRIDSYESLLNELQSIRLPGWAVQE